MFLLLKKKMVLKKEKNSFVTALLSALSFHLNPPSFREHKIDVLIWGFFKCRTKKIEMDSF